MLDMRALFWLENHLKVIELFDTVRTTFKIYFVIFEFFYRYALIFKEWTSTIVIVSHDRSFLNEVCTDIIHLHSKRLDQYRGNYSTFEKTMREKLTQQQRSRHSSSSEVIFFTLFQKTNRR